MELIKHSFNFCDDYIKMFPDAITDEVDEKGERILATRNITFAVTEQCNLRCTYCYQHNKRNKSISKETAAKAIDKLFEEYENDSIYLNHTNAKAIILEFIGGEPLLEIELMDYIVTYFLKKAISLRHRWAIHYMISVSTNGVLYDDPKVEQFIKKYQKRLSFGITVDGNKELHDSCRVTVDGLPSYDKVASNMKKYISINPDASTKLTIAPANIEYLVPAIKNLYEDIGLKFVFANVVYEEGWNEEYGAIFYEKLKELADWFIDSDLINKFECSLFDNSIGAPMSEEDNNNWCGGTGNMLAITSDGNISPCIRYTDYNLNDKQPALVVGNIEGGFASNEKERQTIEMLNAITRRSQSTDECFYCPIASGCSWCSAYNYEIFGTPNKRATYICPMHKSRVLANAYFWNKLYIKYDLKMIYELFLPDEESLKFIDEEELQMIKDLVIEANEKMQS